LRRLTRLIAMLAVLGLCAILYFLMTPYQGFADDTFVELGHGTGAMEMGRELAQAGVIRSPWEFWLERALHAGAKLQAGEYRFNNPATVGDVFGRIARGDIYYLEFTVTEGSNMFDIAEKLEAAGAMTAVDFLKAASDTRDIRDLDPFAKSLEGSFFP
jgi:UPF0755 protein